MMNDIAIKIENLSKVYKLYDHPLDRLKESSPLTFDASKSLDRYERYMDIPTILQTNSFSELIDVYEM